MYAISMFNSNIQGNYPPNTFVYTTSSVSVDNISVTNLSATNASIVNLTTTVFTPVNVNASVITANQIDALEVNVSVTNTSSLNASTGDIDDLNASFYYVDSNNSNVSSAVIYKTNTSLVISANTSVLQSGNITFSYNNSSFPLRLDSDGLSMKYQINSSTLNASTINASLSTIADMFTNEITSGTVNSTYINSSLSSTDVIQFNDAGDLTQFAYVERDANSLRFIGNGNDATCGYDFWTNAGTGDPKLSIARDTNIVSVQILVASDYIEGDISSNLIAGEGIALLTNAGLTMISGTGTQNINTSIVNCSIFSASTGDIDDLNASFYYVDSNNSNVSSAVIYKTNTSLVISANTSVLQSGNITFSYNNSSFPLRLDSDGLSMKYQINTSTLNASTVNASTASVQTLNASTLNASTVNVSVCNGTDVNATTANVSTLEIDTMRIIDQGDTTQFSYIERDANMVRFIGNGFEQAAGYEFYTNDGIGSTPKLEIASATNIVTVQILNATDYIEGDISINLDSGNGIVLDTTMGITTISVSSTMNMSTISASTLNTSQLNASNISATNLTSPACSITTVNTSQLNASTATCNVLGAIVCNVSTANCSKVNASNVSVSGNVSITGTVQADTGNIFICNTSQLNASTIPIINGSNATIGVINATTINASTLNVSQINASNASCSALDVTTLNGGNQLGKASIYARSNDGTIATGTATTYYVGYNIEEYANTSLFTYVAPTSAANTGFICAKAGWYRCSYTANFFSLSYVNRVFWRTRMTVNNAVTPRGHAFGYTREAAAAGTLGCYACSCNSVCVIELAVNDYVKISTDCAKGVRNLGSNFATDILQDAGGSMVWQYLGT